MRKPQARARAVWPGYWGVVLPGDTAPAGHARRPAIHYPLRRALWGKRAALPCSFSRRRPYSARSCRACRAA